MSAGVTKRKRGKGGAQQSSRGFVPRSISGTEANGKVIDLIQQIGELQYEGVHRFEELDPREQRRWIRFSDSVLQAQHNIAQLTAILEQAVEEELGADLRLVRAEIEDIDLRREADLEAQQRDRKQKEAREAAGEKRENARFDADLADRTQRRQERETLLGQGVIERETKRKNQCRRDNLLMTITAISFLCTIALVVLAAASGQASVYGGSGFTALFSIAGMLRLFLFGQGKPPAPPAEPPIGVNA